MKTVRLPKKLENQLKAYAELEGKNESEVMREALVAYMEQKITHITPYEAGKDLFGKVSSGETNLSSTYKSKVKEKIRAKKTSH